MEGIRFIFTSFVPNFTGFAVVGITFIALMGAGVAERAGLMASLIRLLVSASPRRAAGVRAHLRGRPVERRHRRWLPHPRAAGAAAFVSVGGTRWPASRLLRGRRRDLRRQPHPGPVDAQIVADHQRGAERSPSQRAHTIVSNCFFSVVSSIVLAITAAIVTERIVEPRLGPVDQGVAADGGRVEASRRSTRSATARASSEPWSFVARLPRLVLAVTLPPGAPLRDPATGDIIGNTPFMDSLMFIITMMFLRGGIGYGYGARHLQQLQRRHRAVVKTFAGLAGLVFMLLMISQFIAYFNYSQHAQRARGRCLAEWLESRRHRRAAAAHRDDPGDPGAGHHHARADAQVGHLRAHLRAPVHPARACPPQTVLAAYRVGDSPINVVTPLMVYLPFMVTIAQRYQKDAGIGTIIALMMPYVIILRSSGSSCS